MDQFRKYYDLLVAENKKYNLTSLTSEEDVYIKHFEDSLALTKTLDFTKVQSLVDVGSGAGFPGIPLKIKFPHLQLTLIEPNHKKSRFLEKLVLELALNDVIIISERAEEQNSLRESFDVATARAVGPLSLLSELCIPLLKINGFLIIMKGPDYVNDLEAGLKALDILKSRIEEIINYNLSQNKGNRTLIKIKKEAKTPLAYPRPFSIIAKKPL